MKKLFTRYSNGLFKLKSAESAVAKLQEQLTEEEPKLKIADEETKILLTSLEKDKLQETETRKQVAQEEAEAAKQQAEANILKTEAENMVEDANIKLSKTLDKIK